MRRFAWQMLCAGMLLVSGCPHAPTTQPTARDAPIIETAQAASSPAPRDAQPSVTLIFHVDIYLISAPTGSFSNDEEFWKRIDEQVVDVATYDLLYKNGIRVGVAPVSELRHFSKLMDERRPAQKLSTAGQEITNAQIEVKSNLPEQTIFHFDSRNNVVGRSFDRCENLLNISFQPAPRKLGQLRLTLCPMVRAHRKRLQFTALNDEYEMAFVNPEAFYDLKLKADIPMDSFLIITPSPAAARPTSVGHAFFVQEAPAEKLEQVLIVVPRPFRVDRPNTNAQR